MIVSNHNCRVYSFVSVVEDIYLKQLPNEGYQLFHNRLRKNGLPQLKFSEWVVKWVDN